MRNTASASDREFSHHEECPRCGSADNLAVYSDGYRKCFGHGCGFYCYDVKSNPRGKSRSKPVADLFDGEVRPLSKRGISEETCRKFGYWIGKDRQGKPVQIANYFKGGAIVAQKIRYPDKTFLMVGMGKNAPLYGQHLWAPGGKMIVVTEGEIDALTVSQAQGNKWPVVSIPSGAAGAARSVAANLEYLSSFETVVFLFDSDEPGRDAAAECAALLPPGKAKVATLGFKDANEAHLAGKDSEIIQAIWQAKPWRPEGVASVAKLKQNLSKPIEYGLSLPWPGLDRHTYGVRQHEVWCILAGSGVGKTTTFHELEYHFVHKHKQKVGIFHLEEVPDHTAKCIVGKHLNARLHVPGVDVPKEKQDEAFDLLFGSDDDPQIQIFDHGGDSDWNVIESKIRWMVHNGVRFIFIDHITAIAEGKGEESINSVIHTIMDRLNKIVMNLPVTIFLISHLRKTHEKKPAEEGGRITLDDAYGSGAIKQRCHFVLALERDQQGTTKRDGSSQFDAPQNGKATRLRVLKDRFTGSAVGETIYLGWDETTGRKYEITEGGYGGCERYGLEGDDSGF